ncbi:MAG: DUF2236 domain-containing protein [Pseudonocardiales bacterium]|nr:DUF2236 domain-containing protein [Pseudonocardiales bacterium]
MTPEQRIAAWQHSKLFDRKLAMARLLRTGDFVAVRTFGSLAEVEQAGRRVRASTRGCAAQPRDRRGVPDR